MKIGDRVVVSGVGGDFSCLDGATGYISEVLDPKVYTHPYIVIFDKAIDNIESINLLPEELDLVP